MPSIRTRGSVPCRLPKRKACSSTLLAGGIVTDAAQQPSPSSCRQTATGCCAPETRSSRLLPVPGFMPRRRAVRAAAHMEALPQNSPPAIRR